MPEDSSIERLRKRLYKKGEQFESRKERPELHHYRERAPEEWSDVSLPVPDSEIAPEAEELQETEVPRRRFRFFVLIIVFVILALGAVGGGLWYLLGGGSFVSTQSITVTIEGRREIGGGDFAEWNVVVRNNANRALEVADLIFLYPLGARPFGTQAIKGASLRERVGLGRIEPGEVVQTSFQAFVFGEKDAVKTVSAILEYRISGSNAIFEKETTFDLNIVRSPTVVSISAPNDINSGDEIEVRVELLSNAKDLIKNLILELDYPDGFTFKDSSIKPTKGENIWSIGDFAPNDRRIITVRGELTGEDMDERVFRARLGVEELGNFVIYGSEVTSVRIAEQFLGIDIETNVGDKGVFSPSDNVSVKVSWKNNLPVGIENATLKVKLLGRGFEPRSVFVDQGFFVGSENTVVWNPSSFPQFSFLEPGERGEARFRFSVPDTFSVQSQNDFDVELVMEAIFSTPRSPTGFEGVDVTSTRELNLKVSTDLQLVRQGIYHSSILPGSGPLPPKVGEETVYTVVWSLVNTTSDLKNVKVTAPLPPYMAWKSVILPLSENIIFDGEIGRIVWSIDELSAGTGSMRPAREVRFQVGFTPSVADVGKSPIIVSNVIAEGEDMFSGVAVSDTEPALTTGIRGDPEFKYGDERVVQ